jgi:hypothetical protein
MQEMGDGHGRAPADENSHDAAGEAENHGFHEKLAKDVAGAGADRRMPISRVRSVTETSMMFMMPTPPTMSEMSATTSNKFVITRLVAANVSEISV